MIIFSKINSNIAGNMTYNFNIHITKTIRLMLKNGKHKIGNARSVKKKKPSLYVNKKNNYSVEFVMMTFIKAD